MAARMLVLGLTGSIGMGKSTAAALFRCCGIPTHDADAAVHRLLATGGKAVAPIAAAFPGVVIDGAVDRAALGRKVYADPPALRRLERLLHPLVRWEEASFLRRTARARRRVVVLDIPLLFETGGERRVDRVVVVTAPAFLQRMRVLKRPGMTADKLAAILARQMPDRDKRRRADYILHSGLGRHTTLREIRHLLRCLRRARAQRRRSQEVRRLGFDHARNCSRYRNDRA